MHSYSTQLEYSSSIVSTTISFNPSLSSTSTSYPLIITRDTIPLPPPSFLNIPTLQAHGRRVNFIEQHALELRALYYYREENGLAHLPTGSIVPPIMKAGRKAGGQRQGGGECVMGMRTALKAIKPTTQPKLEVSSMTLRTALATIKPTYGEKTHMKPAPEVSAMTIRTALATIKPSPNIQSGPEVSVMSRKAALATTKPASSHRKNIFRRRV
jgi:hypothetical protein